MRVCIAVRRATMGRPASVPDAGPAAQGSRCRIQATLENGQRTGLLDDGQTAMPIHDGNAGGVVTAVLQPIAVPREPAEAPHANPHTPLFRTWAPR